jgi:hypothetical protein
MDAGLGKRRTGRVAGGIVLRDDCLDSWTSLDGHFRAGSSTGHQGANDGSKQTRLTPEGAVDRLNDHLSCLRDAARRCARISISFEHGAGGSHDVLTCLRGLRLAAPTVVAPARI